RLTLHLNSTPNPRGNAHALDRVGVMTVDELLRTGVSTVPLATLSRMASRMLMPIDGPKVTSRRSPSRKVGSTFQLKVVPAPPRTTPFTPIPATAEPFAPE